MAIDAFPFGAQDTTEIQYSKLFRHLQDTGVMDSKDSTSLKVTADGSGLNVKVAAGFAIVRGHAIENDAVITLAIPSPGASTKYHMVVAKLDPGANDITIELIGGTTSIPTPNQTDTGIYEMPLALVTAPSGAVVINSGNVTDLRAFPGKGFACWSDGTRPETPWQGQPGYNTTQDVLEFWDGVAWVTFYQEPPVTPHLDVKKSGTQNVPHATPTTINLATSTKMDGFTAGGSTYWTTEEAGYYNLTGFAGLVSPSNGTNVKVTVESNTEGTLLTAIWTKAANMTKHNVSGEVYIPAGVQVFLQVHHNEGSTLVCDEASLKARWVCA